MFYKIQRKCEALAKERGLKVIQWMTIAPHVVEVILGNPDDVWSKNEVFTINF